MFGKHVVKKQLSELRVPIFVLPPLPHGCYIYSIGLPLEYTFLNKEKLNCIFYGKINLFLRYFAVYQKMKEDEGKCDKQEEKIPLEPLAGPSTSMLPRSPRDRNHGILRLDLSTPRRSSGSSVEFRIPSPLPQVKM